MTKISSIDELKDLFKLLGAKETKTDEFIFLELSSADFKNNKNKTERLQNENKKKWSKLLFYIW